MYIPIVKCDNLMNLPMKIVEMQRLRCEPTFQEGLDVRYVCTYNLDP